MKEQMFGSLHRFDYHQCGTCGCLQIANLPEDLGRYYPKGYYSFCQNNPGGLRKARERLRNFLAIYGPESIFGKLEWWQNGKHAAIRDSGVHRNQSVIDIGCGSGDYISELKDIGFSRVTGADPYIPETVTRSNGVTIRKIDMRYIEERYDFVMMHHSLEHIWDQRETVRLLHQITAPGGRIVVRVPVVDSWAWEEYGLFWANGDAPRHFYLHSRKSISRLLTAAGFRDIRLIDDANSFGILGSEKIRRGLPLMDAGGGTDFDRYFSPDFFRFAVEKTLEMNAAGRGDCIAVHAVKP